MKIAMFTDAYWPRVNGVTVSVDSFSRTLINYGHEVLIVCPSYPEDSNNPVSNNNSDAENKLKIVRVPSTLALVTKEDRLAKFNKWYWVFKQVEDFNPDVLHVNSELVIGEFGFWYGRSHNLPIVYTFHTLWEDYAPNYLPMFPSFLLKFVVRRMQVNILRRCYRVIVPTTQIQAVVHKYRKKTKTSLLPTGIDIDMFNHDAAEVYSFREKMEERFPQIKGKRILLFAGRVVKEKNIGFLINIFPDILAKHSDVVLLIAGNGPDMDYYQDEAQKAGIKDNCVFTGYFNRDELALVYAISELFVFPSLTDTQGLVTLEAMLSGTPVVAIGVMGTITVMGGDNGGFMVKNDPAEFTARVLELLADPELRQKKSIEAKAHARSWSIDELTKELLNIYKSAVASYTEEFGHRITPVWDLLMDKRWWKINQKIFRKRGRKKWLEMLEKLNIRYTGKRSN